MSFTDKFKFIKTSCVENKCPTITALTAIDTKNLEKIWVTDYHGHDCWKW